MKIFIHINHFIIIGLFVAVSLLSASCKKDIGNPKFNAVLNDVETYVNNHPDSAKTVLMPYIKIASDVNGCNKLFGVVTEEQRARYCLLMTTAIYKTNCLTSDSLINIAADYYLDSKGHNYYKALTYLNLGFANFALNKNDKAVSNYYSALNTIHLIKHTDLDKLNFLYFSIYSNLGIIYCNQGIYNDAIIMYRQAFKYASLLKDTYRMSMQLCGIALSYTTLENYDSALFYCDQSIKMCKKQNQSVSYSMLGYNQILFVKSINLMRKGNINSAYSDLTTAYNNSLQDSNYIHTIDYENIVQTLGELFLQRGEVDSAKILFKSLIVSDNAYTRWNAYNRLYEISKINDKDFVSALKYYEEANKNEKQANDDAKAFETQQITNSYEFQKERAIIDSQNKIKMWSSTAIFLVIIIAILIAYLILNNHIQHEKEENERLKNELAIKEQNINLLVKELENLTLQFEESNKIIDKSDIELSETEKQIHVELIKSSIIYRKAKSIEQNGIEKVKCVLTEDDWNRFVKYTNLIYNHFVDNLLNAYPDLLKWDIRVCCLLKNQFSRITIAELLGLELNSLQKKEKRITKNKIKDEDTGKDLTLDDLLNQFK